MLVSVTFVKPKRPIFWGTWFIDYYWQLWAEENWMTEIIMATKD